MLVFKHLCQRTLDPASPRSPVRPGSGPKEENSWKDWNLAMARIPQGEWLQRHAADIVETLHEPVLALDSAQCIIWANAPFCRLLQLPRDKVTGRSLKELHDGVFAQSGLVELLEDMLPEQKSIENHQVEIHLPSGPRYSLMINARLLGLEVCEELAGKISADSQTNSAQGILLTMFDVSQQVRVDAQKARLAALVESSSDAIIARTFDGTIVDWNTGAEKVYGYTTAEAVGKSISIIIPEDRRHETTALDERMRAGKSVRDQETERVRKDGRRMTIALTMSPIKDGRGRTVLISTIERDITRRVQRERELRHARDEAERATRLQGEFLANVSHELRTPMNAIIGMTDLALDEQLSGDVRDYLQTVRTSAGVLMELLNDVLDFSKLESGNFDIEESPFRIDETVQEALRSVSLPAYEKGLEIIGDVDENVPLNLLGDSLRLQQVLMNLLTNAVKFTEAGEVELRVSLLEELKDRVKLHFSVRDTGIGIPREHRAEIFAPFRQADSSSTRVHGGSGLGLAIVTQLVELMDGDVNVDSEPGKGSTFSFTAEFGRRHHDHVRAPEAQKKSVRVLRGLPVLVVDDNQTNREFLKRVLQNWSLRPETVESGREAVRIMKERASRGEPYQLVLLDALMPEIDGFEVAAEIGKDPVLAKTTLLMLSSADRQAFRDRLQNLPVDDFLEKPVSQSDLWDSIATSLGGMAVKRPQVPQSAAAASRKLHVLLVEDMPANQKVIVRILEKRGHRVSVAANGRLALDLLNAGEATFDLVLMDVQMPTMDGYQTTAAVRQSSDAGLRKLPIIAMTAHAMKGDREKCLAAGMDGYLSKPVDARKLVTLVEGYAFDSTGGSPLTADSTAEGVFDLLEVLDIEGALTRLGGDQSLMEDMLAFFIEDVPPLLEQLQSSHARQDARELERTAHSLKGLLANFDGSGNVVELAERLQQHGYAVDFDAAAKLIPRLQRRTNRMIEAARAFLEPAE